MASKKLTTKMIGAHKALVHAIADVRLAEVLFLQSMGWTAVQPEGLTGSPRWRDYVRPPLQAGAPPMLVKQEAAVKRELERNFKQ